MRLSLQPLQSCREFFWLLAFLWCAASGAIRAEDTNRFLFATLNCYWYFQSGNNTEPEARLSRDEWNKKAGHLIGLLPDEPPLFVAFQEIGDTSDVSRLARAASRRYRREYQPLFIQGRDSATAQDVAAILDTSRGWGIHGQPSRVSELERELTKHLVVRLTNSWTHLDAAVVHLRVPRTDGGLHAQRNQNRALLRWTMRHLSGNTNANVILLGDFNELERVGDPSQSLAPLFSAEPPLIDLLEKLDAERVTHARGKAPDRILVSQSFLQGASGLKFEEVQVRTHRRGTGADRRLYTDHYPVIAAFRATRPGE